MAGSNSSVHGSPFRKRSYADLFRFNFTCEMSYALCFQICQARLSWRVLNTLSDGVEPGLIQALLATKI